MTSSTDNPLRITRNEVPSTNPDIEIIAGWNGNVWSYYFVATWVRDQPSGPKAGTIDMEAGYPLEIISELPLLASFMLGHVDLSSPDTAAVFFNLLADKMLDLCIAQTNANPYGNKHLPELISKVLGKDFTPIVAPAQAPPPPPRHAVFDPRHFNQRK
jgi:hypothetical protein